MRHFRISILALITLATIAFTACREEPVTEGQVLQTLDSLEIKLGWIEHRLAQEQWYLAAGGHSDSLAFFEDLYRFVMSNERTWRILDNGRRLVRDDIDQRRLALLEAAIVLDRVESSRNVRSLRDSLQQLKHERDIRFDGNPASLSELTAIVSTGRDRGQRERAYRIWASAATDGVGQLFRLRNQEARKLGYNNYLALAFARNGLDPTAYVRLLSQLDSLSRPAYENALEEIQTQLGYDQLELWDLAYAANDVRRRVDARLPVDSQLTFINRGLSAWGYELDKLPIYFDPLYPASDISIARQFTLSPARDIRILIDPVPGMHGLRTLFHEVGKAIHAVHISQGNPLFARTRVAAWHEGMAETVAAMCDNRSWLELYAGFSGSLAASWTETRKQQRLIALRLLITRLMFEYEAYTNSNRDLGKLYWDLFERYMLLPRHDELQSWAAVDEYVTRSAGLHADLYGKMIAAQTRHQLRELYGSLAGEKAVGAFLVQNYFRFGSRYDWRDLLERGTDSPLDPTHLINELTD